MSSLEDELIMYVGVPNETNQLVLNGDVTTEFNQTLMDVQQDLKLEPREQEATPDKKSRKKSFNKTKKIKCSDPDCIKLFDDEEKMTRHVRKVHRGEHPYQCNVCHYGTSHKACYDEHMRVHSGIKPFKCSFCNYTSASKKNAKSHERTKHGDNPLRCPECNTVFRTAGSLKEHISKKHTTQRSCRHCLAKFPSLEKLRYHQKTYVKTCAKCPAKLCSKDLMAKHLADVHHEYYYHEKDGSKKKRSQGKPMWICKICQWEAHNLQKTLLHLIHHPNQEVEDDIDLTPLRKYGIVP